MNGDVMSDVDEMPYIHSLLRLFSPQEFAPGLAPEWQSEKNVNET